MCCCGCRTSARALGPPALAGVSLEARGGEVLALIGENGAGKSTLMKILSRRDRAGRRPDGTGRPARTRRPVRTPRALAGVAMIYQELNLAPRLERRRECHAGRGAGALRRDPRRGPARARCATPWSYWAGPTCHSTCRSGELSVADQQVVEIARALAIEAKVIVFDEPTSSLTQHDVESLFHVIEKLKRSGIAIIYISHFLEEIRRIADRYTVLRDGSAAGSGQLAGVSERQIISLMVGRDVEDLFPTRPAHARRGDPVARRAGRRRMPRDVSFELRRGEILGIAGLVGAGRTELLRCLLALDPVRSGTRAHGGHHSAGHAAGADPRRTGPGVGRSQGRGAGAARNDRRQRHLQPAWIPTAAWAGSTCGGAARPCSDWMSRLSVKARSPRAAGRTPFGRKPAKGGPGPRAAPGCRRAVAR